MGAGLICVANFRDPLQCTSGGRNQPPDWPCRTAATRISRAAGVMPEFRASSSWNLIGNPVQAARSPLFAER